MDLFLFDVILNIFVRQVENRDILFFAICGDGKYNLLTLSHNYNNNIHILIY